MAFLVGPHSIIAIYHLHWCFEREIGDLSVGDGSSVQFLSSFEITVLSIDLASEPLSQCEELLSGEISVIFVLLVVLRLDDVPLHHLRDLFHPVVEATHFIYMGLLRGLNGLG